MEVQQAAVHIDAANPVEAIVGVIARKHLYNGFVDEIAVRQAQFAARQNDPVGFVLGQRHGRIQIVGYDGKRVLGCRCFGDDRGRCPDRNNDAGAILDTIRDRRRNTLFGFQFRIARCP